MAIISFCNKELQLNLIKLQMNRDRLLSFNSKHCFDSWGGLSKMSCSVVLFSKIFKHLISIIPCSLFWSLYIKPFGLAARWMYFSFTQIPPQNSIPSVVFFFVFFFLSGIDFFFSQCYSCINWLLMIHFLYHILYIVLIYSLETKNYFWSNHKNFSLHLYFPYFSHLRK